jgi:lysophospholipase L1-like esterase
VLCFGDSLTEGYYNVWHHPTFGGGRPDPARWPEDELLNLRLYPYSIALGAALAADDAGIDGGYASALRYAVCRAYSGWKAADMLTPLKAALSGGPYRAAVILAGSNDIVQGASAEDTLPGVLALHEACEQYGVPVVVIPNTDCDMQHHGMCTNPTRQRAELAKLARLIDAHATAAGRAVVAAREALPMDDAHADLWDDSIHFSPAGSRQLAGLVHASMRKHGL